VVFAWFGFFALLFVIILIIISLFKWISEKAFKVYLASQTSEASLLVESAIKSQTPPKPTPPIIEVSLNEKRLSSLSAEDETNST